MAFLEYGLRLAEREDQDICPLCLQDITGPWDETEVTVKEHFVSQHRKFLEQYQDFDPKDVLVGDLRWAHSILQQLVDCKSKFDQNQRVLSTLFDAYKAQANSLGEEVSPLDFDALAPLELDFSSPQLLLGNLDLALQFLDGPEEVEFTPLDGLSKQIDATAQLAGQLSEVQRATQDSIDSLNSQYQQTRESLEEKKQDGLDEEVQKWKARLAEFELLDDLQGLESEAAGFEEATDRMSTVNRYIRALLDVRDTLRDTEEILLAEAIERISRGVNEIYKRMNPDEALNRIIFRPAGGRNVDLIVDDENIDLSDKEPRPLAFLSEGHLNCLGIAIHLALQEVIDSPYDFVIFDDPLYSIDAGHRRKALDEMFDFAKRTGKQLIIATHDPLFFHYLKEKLQLRRADFGRRRIYLVVNYSSTEPDIIIEGSKGTFLDAAKEKLIEGCDSYDLEAVYVLIRREMEYICDKLLEGQRVAAYGEKYDKLESRIDLLRRLGYIDDADINKLREARTVCNPAAHYDPQRESYTVARQVLTDIEAFRNKYLRTHSDASD